MISENHPKKLFLLDAFALIYRAYFAFAKNPRVNSKGQNTSAAFGFTNALIDVLLREKPTHIAVVFDAPGGASIRVEDFAAYKANRQEMPEDIRSMIDPIKEILKAFKIPVLLKTGYEADDIIGTLAKEAEKHGFLTYMMTPDKDFGQLVSENIKIYKPGRGGDPASIMGVAEVCEKFEIDNPLKVIDILGLWGDAVDNIPGIPGVGEKTAKKLIQDFGSMEGIFANTDQFKGKLKENLENFQEQGLLSKMLATIVLDVPVEFDAEDLKLSEFDQEAVKDIFTELEFRNLAKRILGEEIIVTQKVKPKAGQQLDLFGEPLDLFSAQSLVEEREASPTTAFKTMTTEKASYHLVTLPEERQKLLKMLMEAKEVSWDTETSSIEPFDAQLVGISFSIKAREGFYVATPAKDFEATKAIVEEFLPFFQSQDILKIGHNLKYDLSVLSNYGVEINYPMFDTMVAHYLIQPEARQSMDFLAEYYLQYQPVSIESLIGKKGKDQGTMLDLKPEEVSDYACEDADITFQLFEIFAPKINETHLKDLFYNLEMPLVQVLMEMEREGIAIDADGLGIYSKQLEQELASLESSITELAGETFNIDSPKKLGEILFDKLKISTKVKKTKTGQYATGEDILQKHKNDHAIIPFILDYRQLRKLKNTYVDPLPSMASDRDGRVHTHYMQTITATGRLSSNGPNLQNIPIRSEKGKEIRKAFIAKNENYRLLAADYSQIELRIIAALSNDENMIEAFQNKVDIHSATAAKVFQVDLADVTRDQRSAAKAVNFGILYGQSAFGLSQTIGVSRTEAKSIIDSYFAQFSKLKSYMDSLVNQARDFGYVETIKQRRRYLPDINSGNAVVRGFAERNAVNAPIQGSAADVIKLAMIAIQGEIKAQQLTSRLLLQVHDELVFDVLKSEEEILKKLVRSCMENAVIMTVPLDVEMEIGENWLEAH
jgi:DNA polymerase I